MTHFAKGFLNCKYIPRFRWLEADCSQYIFGFDPGGGRGFIAVNEVARDPDPSPGFPPLVTIIPSLIQSFIKVS
jgi:hypothetical protein